MAKKIKLRDDIKFRRERGYILLCDCKNLEDYELPLRCYTILSKLKKGILKNKVKDENLIRDLIKIKAVE